MNLSLFSFLTDEFLTVTSKNSSVLINVVKNDNISRRSYLRIFGQTAEVLAKNNE